MKFIKSKHFNKEFLGKRFYAMANYRDELLTIQEFFNINDTQKEYLKEGKSIDNKTYSYKLTVQENYYELDCQSHDTYLFLVFDKPVHIVGPICSKIIAPEIIVKNSENNSMFQCVANKVTINNNYECYYSIDWSKIEDVYFYNPKVSFWYAEIENFFIYNKKLKLYNISTFLNYHKIKCFGTCYNIKERLSNNIYFQKGVVHVK